MGRIVKVILVHIAITMLIAFVLPSSQSPPGPGSSPDLSSTVWDCQHNLLRPTYPPQDLQGRYLPPPRDQRTSGEDNVGEELKKLMQTARDGEPHYR